MRRTACAITSGSGSMEAISLAIAAAARFQQKVFELGQGKNSGLVDLTIEKPFIPHLLAHGWRTTEIFAGLLVKHNFGAVDARNPAISGLIGKLGHGWRWLVANRWWRRSTVIRSPKA